MNRLRSMRFERNAPMPPSNLARLKDEEWERLQQLADGFEQAWQRGPHVPLDQFLPPSGDALRPVALHELIKTDLEMQWRHARPALLESYLEKFPELGGSRDLPAHLI